MYYVGVDIAKSFHVASVIDDLGVIRVEAFSFNNNLQGFSILLDALSPYSKEELIIGLESTAHYGEVFAQFFFKHGFKVAIVNPLQTSAIRKAGIRKTKTDKIDSFNVAKSLMFYGYTPLKKIDIDHLKLKSLAKTRRKLLKQQTTAKIQLVAYVDQIFPELAKFFKNNLHIKTVQELILQHSSPSKISNIHLTKLSNLLIKASRGRYTKEDAKLLKILAKESVGLDDSILELQIQMTIQQIRLFSSQIDEVEKQSKEILEKLDSIILTVPGISYNAATAILGILGDFKQFSSPKKIVAFAGLDPKVYESGNFKASSTRMSKRGNSLLRYHLIYTAYNLSLRNKTFKEYYNLKREQGKSHYNALGHVANKVIRVLYKIMTEDIPFNLS